MNHQLKYGFQKTAETPVAELDAVMHHFVHEKTGLELVWLDRKEENKTFAISFTTLPENDTGVFHILEHSTLCGSEKYPVKEPFVELMKGSMNTFLNAMTFPDKTVYPVSSKNSKDFMNLVSVYLDAVFCPMIYQKPEIFRQEGRHYEFDEDGSACYNGVVFNEMKGVYADPDELTENALAAQLFPDTPYHFAYGGDPSKIPDLSYEEFLETHRRFYSPSNAYVFLDGNLDLDAVLKLLDEAYLSGAEKTKRIAPPALQKPVKGTLVQTEYEVSCPEEEEGTARLIFGNVIGTFKEREKAIAVYILSDVLCGYNHSPLSKAILEAGLAEDVILSVQDELLQPYAKLELRNISVGDVATLEEVVKSTLLEVAEKGIDQELLEAAIANTRFRLQERDFGEYPQGLMLCFQALESWLYGGNPEDSLEYEALFQDLECKAKQGYFELLIKEVLLENPHSCEVLLVPSHTLGEQRREAEEARLNKELSALDETSLQDLYQQQNNLMEWQMEEDDPEVLSAMPELKLSDIDAKPEKIPTEITDIDGIKVLLHPIGQNGICYCNLYFPVEGFSEQELSALSFLCGLFGKLGTDTYTAEQLTNELRKLFGDIQFSITSFSEENETNSCSIKLQVSFSTFRQNLDAALKLTLHILQNTKLDQASVILDLLRQQQITLYQELSLAGSSAAIGRISAGSTVSGVVTECCSGIAYYQALESLEEKEDFSFLQELGKRVLCKKGLTVSLTGDFPELSSDTFVTLPAEGTSYPQSALQPWGAASEGFIIPSDVSFAALGGNFVPHGGQFTSRMSLAAHLVSLDYLWNVVRVQGGAYGTGLGISESGFCACYSYRDPSAADSLEAFSKSGAYLNAVAESGADLTGEIIGTIAEGSPLLSIRMKGQTADSLYFKKISYEKLCSRRQELLSTSAKDLSSLAALLNSTLQENSCICVIGSKEQVQDCTCLKKIITL